MQSLAETHDTLDTLRELDLGLVTIFHLCPSQRSTSMSPAAIQALLDVHETLDRVALEFGMRSDDHLWPFHRKATAPYLVAATAEDLVVSVSPGGDVYPTAMQNVFDVHDTEFNTRSTA
jgi:hypothetical protein